MITNYKIKWEEREGEYIFKGRLTLTKKQNGRWLDRDLWILKDENFYHSYSLH